MIRVIFKNLENSELAKDAAVERIEPLVEKFPELARSRVRVTLEMQNSPLQAGPDLFSVSVQVYGGRYDGIRVRKSAPNLYEALAAIVEHLLEVLNRFGDRLRVRQRSASRNAARAASDWENAPRGT